MSQFTSGSRQAPDPFDQFLEENNFYRKHTARDASCLFRCISEQMYDTQDHYSEIRKKCVLYMRQNHLIFKPLVDRDINEYLDEMLQPRTYGTLTELQALSSLFKRDVMMFEPYSLGKILFAHPDNVGLFQIFYSPERHFDSVFTCEYIKKVAICQAVCYEMLYVDLFKLPDVDFAIDSMLHMDILNATANSRSKYNEEGYCTRMQLSNGEIYELNLPQITNCILEDKKRCKFHDSGRLQAEPIANSIDEPKSDTFDTNQDGKLETRLIESVSIIQDTEFDWLLPNKYISCVRQLLTEGITPFPYKVAKALNALMYRNIEFDSWNEVRKELKFLNMYREETNLKVGAKCHVKLSGSDKLYTGYIQDLLTKDGYCSVFVEQLGEKHSVPYESINQIPLQEYKSKKLPSHMQRYIQKLSAMRLGCNYNLKIDYNYFEKYRKNNNFRNRNDCVYNLSPYINFDNFQPYPVEYYVMPLSINYGMCNNPEMTPTEPAEQRNYQDIADIQTRQPRALPGTTDILNSTGAVPQPSVYPVMESRERDSNVTDLHSIETQYSFPMPYYSNAIDYFPYGSGNIATPQQYIYMCNSTTPVIPQNNVYIPQTMSHTMQSAIPSVVQPVLPMQVAQSQQPIQMTSAGAAYFNQTQFYGPSTVNVAYNTAAFNGNYWSGFAPVHLNSPNSSNNEIPPVVEQNETNNVTSTNETVSTREHRIDNSEGAVNFNQSLSGMSDGSDLPTDMATLRFFFNLGVEKYKEVSGNNENSSGIIYRKQNSLTFEKQRNEQKSDLNNNTRFNANSIQPNRNNANANNGRFAINQRINSNRRCNGNSRSRGGERSVSATRFTPQNGGNQFPLYENNQMRNGNSINNAQRCRFGGGGGGDNISVPLNNYGAATGPWNASHDIPQFPIAEAPAPPNADYNADVKK